MVSVHILFEMQSSSWKVSDTLLPQDCLLLSAAAPFQMLSFSLVLFLASAMSVVRHLQGDDIMGGPCLQPPGMAWLPAWSGGPKTLLRLFWTLQWQCLGPRWPRAWSFFWLTCVRHEPGPQGC